jgi:uncharacterized protein YbjT (DUF2867 family)
MITMRALIVGSTGLVGGHLLQELLTSEHFSEVESWIRKPTGTVHPKLKERIVDFDRLDRMEVTPATHVFCCLGTTIKKAKSQEAFRRVDYRYVAELAALAMRSGSKVFTVVSSVGADPKSGNFYLRTKGEMEEAVKQSGVPVVVILRPSMLMGERKEFRLGEQVGKWVMKAVHPLLLGSLRKYRGVGGADVARVMIRLSLESAPGVRIWEGDRITK